LPIRSVEFLPGLFDAVLRLKSSGCGKWVSGERKRNGLARKFLGEDR